MLQAVFQNSLGIEVLGEGLQGFLFQVLGQIPGLGPMAAIPHKMTGEDGVSLQDGLDAVGRLESREVPTLDMGEEESDELDLLEHHVPSGPNRVRPIGPASRSELGSVEVLNVALDDVLEGPHRAADALQFGEVFEVVVIAERGPADGGRSGRRCRGSWPRPKRVNPAVQLPKPRRRRSRLIRARHRPVQPHTQDSPHQQRGQGDRYGTY